jgi:hypothetical protein
LRLACDYASEPRTVSGFGFFSCHGFSFDPFAYLFRHSERSKAESKNPVA